MKPGYLTTEFWAMIASKAIALAVTVGVLTVNQGQDWQTHVANAITGIAAIVWIVGQVNHYIDARSALKRMALAKDHP